MKTLDEFFNNEVMTTKFLKVLADKAVERIVTRTRLGYGVAGHGQPQKKLNPLAPSTKSKRKRLQKAGKLSPNTSPAKSNLTETGQLLDSITYEIKDNNAFIYVQGEANEKKLLWTSTKDRPFFFLTDANLRELQSLIAQEIAKNIHKYKLPLE